ncbi:5-oxoprolinase subunit B family protein [Cupriavidus taiwanensis]|uniref:Carboxyltransferase domain-containing protein n=1 Tax=Cupriavidus taiwanensis TaxID=164546 RepID=A0A7Z7JGL5_9BURK|nr:allophanate hydrolase subunit 1 [Cupriavidus taiwanensis]SOZ19517.1 conserved hypothetical protein [Cupriavidus taiwanensis]SOZ97295.1 conserved hypothetical protein [Cupriavidus taiwanensis]SPC26184.1 conserved hypothetical protein [Cupriavidus taiwanensis]SPD37684.1 conserved protein of unknown function [Cupriavidus taiwanensis]
MTVLDQLERFEECSELRQAKSDRGLRISAAGVGGLLLDPSQYVFDMETQQRLLELASRLRDVDMKTKGIRQTLPGVNNLLVMFDPLQLEPAAAADLLLKLWACTESKHCHGKSVVFDVDYGGDAGPDLIPTAEALGVSVASVVCLHSEATYTVAAVGSMPGFAYMTGLPNELHMKRRSTPRLSLAAGSVIVGGPQASVLPMAGPCGWHALGHMDTPLFDPSAEIPCLLSPGDTVRFNVRKVLS